MKGYFSRIIQQTGINVGAAGDFKRGSSELPTARSHESDEITPLHIEERRIIAPQQHQRIELESGISEEPRPKTDDKNVPPVSDKRKFESKIIADEFDRGVPVSKEKDTTHDATSQAKKTGIEIPHVDIREPTLHEAREWVAETPDIEFEKIQHDKDVKKIVRIDDEWPETSGLRNFYAASGPRSLESPQREKPEIHDFHLSIGKISLTIEEPERKIHEMKPQQKRQEKKHTQPGVSSTRLSRYYIK